MGPEHWARPEPYRLNGRLACDSTATTIFASVEVSRLNFMDESPRIERNKQQKTAQLLIGLGSLVVLVGAALHLVAAFPTVSAALTRSNLDEGLGNALRAVFLMIGLTWIVIAVVTLIATFLRAQTSKLIILFCGFALLLQIPIWVGLMGWFVGNEMFVLGAGLIVCGGLLFRAWRSV